MTETIETVPETAETTSGVAVLDRAFALLSAFGVTDTRLTLTELSRRTGLYKSTVLRLLSALEHGGYIRKTPDGLYTIGPEPLRLAAVYQGSFAIAQVVEPLLSQLSMASGETASFYIRRDDQRVVLFRAEPPRAVRFSIRVGEAFRLDQGASGKVLVSFANGISVARNQAPLWRVSHGERDPETASLAVPVFGVTGELQGALTLSGPKSRMVAPEAMVRNCGLLLEAARKAVAPLGGDESIYESSIAKLADKEFLADFK
jgi:DNA-binding IclR family transcriptional regulator